MTSNCQNITVLMTRKAIYFGHQPNNVDKVAFLWASPVNRNGGSLPSRMCCFITITPTISLPHLPILTCTVCCFWAAWILKMEERRFPKYVDNCLPVCVLSCHSTLEPHHHHCKNLKTFKDLFCSSVMSVAICFVQFWHLTIQWCSTDDPSI